MTDVTTTEQTAAAQDAGGKEESTTLLNGAKPDSKAEGNQQQQAAGDQKQDGARSGDAPEGKTGEDKKADEGKAQGAPEKYEFKAPEGQEFDADAIAAFSDVAREANLSQEHAQQILDRMGESMQARQTKVRDAWVAEIRGDKELGGEKLTETLAVANKALSEFGSDGLRALLNAGLGDNPDVIRFLYRAGKAISEDTFVAGKEAKGAVEIGKRNNDQLAEALYRNSQH